ncbi:MAG: DUF3181 family protein [Aphanocapsa feldmannii 277cV]|uniref:DUF3181 family protein n=2 Tax=Aphanocapsa feldmannii TaxID=192050 RepID=A0A524RPK1_9CHRO|nr:MAG: DUF3181 family protein [Aphanocapsa feldmannii 288cV]TGG93732.1 MAG: DUF3181 family protein [Aphanocapsa feldmannii 277cV]TGH27603.1 MAG: DUF3181 family protein [Aphanocapsa feldmannii 277cI]
MTLPAADLLRLREALADRVYLRICRWHLYLGDAQLAAPLAESLAALLDQGPAAAASQAAGALKVPVGDGKHSVSLAVLLPSSQMAELKDIAAELCR